MIRADISNLIKAFFFFFFFEAGLEFIQKDSKHSAQPDIPGCNQRSEQIRAALCCIFFDSITLNSVSGAICIFFEHIASQEECRVGNPLCKGAVLIHVFSKHHLFLLFRWEQKYLVDQERICEGQLHRYHQLQGTHMLESINWCLGKEMRDRHTDINMRVHR